MSMLGQDQRTVRRLYGYLLDLLRENEGESGERSGQETKVSTLGTDALKFRFVFVQSVLVFSELMENQGVKATLVARNCRAAK